MSLIFKIIAFFALYLVCGVLIATLTAIAIPDTDEDGFITALCMWPFAGVVVLIYVVSHYSYMLVSRYILKFVRRKADGKPENS